MKNRVYIFIGLPATGKSTFIRENGLQYKSLAFDNIGDFFPTIYDGNERYSYALIKKTIMTIMNDFFKSRYDFIVDRAYYRFKEFKEFYDLATRYGYEIVAIDFSKKADGTKWTFDELVKNNECRKEKENISNNYLDKYLSNDIKKILKYISTLNNVRLISREKALDEIKGTDEYIDLSEYDNIYVIYTNEQYKNITIPGNNFYIYLDSEQNPFSTDRNNIAYVIGNEVRNKINMSILENTNVYNMYRYDIYFKFKFKGKKYIVTFNEQPYEPRVINRVPYLNRGYISCTINKVRESFIKDTNGEVTLIYAGNYDIFEDMSGFVSLAFMDVTKTYDNVIYDVLNDKKTETYK